MLSLRTMLVVVASLGMMQLQLSEGHGYVMDPPQRSSMWRFGYGTPANYDDSQLFCGGFSRQWNLNGGKCGICGDAYDDPQPRANEAGGKYAKGIIVRTYTKGQVIDVTVRITANHMGYFLFKLCPNNDAKKEATQECLDQHVLQTVTSSGKLNGTRFYIDRMVSDKHVRLQLPDDITCTQCVLQWTYNTGNSWGCEEDGTCCTGCGPQENFVNCVDIAITATGQPATTSATAQPTPQRTTERPATTTNENPKPTTTQHSITTEEEQNPTTQHPTTQQPTQQPTTQQPTTAEQPTTKTATAAPTQPPVTETPKPQSEVVCKAIGIWKTIAGMDNWCTLNCSAHPPYCPETHCKCE